MLASGPWKTPTVDRQRAKSVSAPRGSCGPLDTQSSGRLAVPHPRRSECIRLGDKTCVRTGAAPSQQARAVGRVSVNDLDSLDQGPAPAHSSRRFHSRAPNRQRGASLSCPAARPDFPLVLRAASFPAAFSESGRNRLTFGIIDTGRSIPVCIRSADRREVPCIMQHETAFCTAPSLHRHVNLALCGHFSRHASCKEPFPNAAQRRGRVADIARAYGRSVDAERQLSRLVRWPLRSPHSGRSLLVLVRPVRRGRHRGRLSGGGA